MGVNKKDKKSKIEEGRSWNRKKKCKFEMKKKKKKVSGSPFKIQKRSKTITRVTIQYT